MTKTNRIAGHRLTLTVGVRYIASRQFAGRGREVFPVTISELRGRTGGAVDIARGPLAVATVDGLSYDAANRLLNSFNHGVTSFDGRLWK